MCMGVGGGGGGGGGGGPSSLWREQIMSKGNL